MWDARRLQSSHFRLATRRNTLGNPLRPRSAALLDYLFFDLFAVADADALVEAGAHDATTSLR